MSKRQKFVLTSFVLTGLLVWANLVTGEWYIEMGENSILLQWRYVLIGFLGLMSGVATWWALRGGGKGVARWMTVVLPVLFSLGAGMFTFLLPEVVPGLWTWSWGREVGTVVGWSLRGSFWVVYLLSIYSLLLTENIWSVSAIRTIALARAAGAVGFLLTLVTGFFLYDAVWSFRLPFYWNALLVFGLSFPLLLQGLWSVGLDEEMNIELWVASGVLALAIGETALVLSFWPVSVVVASLVITTLLYVLLGIYQQYLSRRLFIRTLWEYVSVGCLVLGVILLTTRWAA